MGDERIPNAIMLAEVLRLQRWAGGDSVSAAHIFGLMHGFETELRQEREGFGISEDTQTKVEDMLDDVERGKQSTDGPAIKERLRQNGVEETDAHYVMQLCRLRSRFLEGVSKVVGGKGSVFLGLDRLRLPEGDWFGALHYVELLDCTEDTRTPMHAVFCPTVPRVGEIVQPQNGSSMRVVGVEHRVISQGDQEGISQHYLVPHVLLTPDDDIA